MPPLGLLKFIPFNNHLVICEYFFLSLSFAQILSESYLLDKKSAEYNNQNNQNIQAIHSICGAGITSAAIDDDSASDTTKSSVVSERTEDTDLSSNVSTTPPTSTVSLNSVVETKSKKESGFLNKCKSQFAFSMRLI